MSSELKLEPTKRKMVDVAVGVVDPRLSETASVTSATSYSYLSQMEEDEDYPKSFQEELNEILEAWYELLSEEDILQYQKYLEDITGKKVAENALQIPGELAPDFELPDQDGEVVNLDELCQKGPVVLVFYRGKWCPHCNTVIQSMQRILPRIEALGAQVVCISPMMPDGTQYMATKLQLGFPVCSDVGNVAAKAFNIAFEVHEDVRESFLKWDEDVPKFNGDFTWEIPLPATYIITKGDRRIAWSFVDNDSGVRADPEDILANIPRCCDEGTDAAKGCSSQDENKCRRNNRGTGYATTYKKLKGSVRGSLKSSLRKSKKLFGKKKQDPLDFLMSKF